MRGGPDLAHSCEPLGPGTVSHAGADGGRHTASAIRGTSSVEGGGAMDSSQVAFNVTLGTVRMGRHKARWKRCNAQCHIVYCGAGNDGKWRHWRW